MTTKVQAEAVSNIFSLPYLVARDKGYFTDEDLDVEFISDKRAAPAGIVPVEDHRLVDAFGAVSPFESGKAEIYRACEWGQVRRSHDSRRGGKVVSKRAAVASQAIFVLPGSEVSHPQDLANLTVGVQFHHGSHYIALQMLEGFLPREEIKVVHAGSPYDRFQALRDGTIDAVALMEPWITVSEKLGFKRIAEAHYVGAEIAAPSVTEETFGAINRAINRAVEDLRTDPLAWVHYLIEALPAEIQAEVSLTPQDFAPDRLRFVPPQPYGQEQFRRTYDWMVSWDLIPDDSAYSNIVENRITAIA
ncbi:ABC transporter substrate-binding protein [Actinacidiphila sp. ITFR-21]|uniref:ABC transporter substrate-binding protein n=1 Tax=Actinacidiphila sp. ITFR-21 TaxID=3075199 RepID=UPI00288C3AA7|nr:ABC transporter substrate-binding protein [Streptomyces sp. ITFR-21]WNI18759.1 ABC transporter substrate-binding protein [Streptomyces sp. ITFR-21]